MGAAVGGILGGGQVFADTVMNRSAKWNAERLGRTVQETSESTEAERRANPGTVISAEQNKSAVAESTKINTNPATHTPQEQAVIEEYQGAVDQNLVDYYNSIYNGNAKGFYVMKPVSDRAASDILAITGKDVAGFGTRFDARQMYHVKNDHGPNGKANHSMADSNDVGRIQFVLDNYDSVHDGGTTDAYWEPKPNGKNHRAHTIIFEKKVNGTYYVVEAAPITKAKQVYIVSAYMSDKGEQKRRTASDFLDTKGPLVTSEAPGQNAVPNRTLAQSRQEVNENQNQKTGSGGRSGLPSVLELPSETLREWMQAAGHTGESISGLRELYIRNGMTPEEASRTAFENLLNRYAEAFRNGSEGVTARAVAEAAERERLERTVTGKNTRYGGTAEALVEAALRLPRSTEARNLAEQASVARQAEILGKLDELAAAKKQAGKIQTPAQLTEFTRTIGRLEQELEALEQGRFSDRLDNEALGRLAKAVENGKTLQAAGLASAHSTTKNTGKLTEQGEHGNLNDVTGSDFYVSSKGKVLPAKYKDWLGENQREKYMSSASDPHLKKIIGEIYRPGSIIGDGGTADSIRFERETGILLCRAGHIQKGREMIRCLERFLEADSVSENDQIQIQQLLSDLREAVKEG